MLIPCLKSPHISIQWRAAELIAELTQNNPYCQSRILSAGLLPSLLDMVDNGSSEAVKVKALYAVSCKYIAFSSCYTDFTGHTTLLFIIFFIGLVRDNTAALDEFSKKDGFSVLLRAMQSNNEKLKVKSAFLLSALCGQHPAIRGECSFDYEIS